MLDFLASYWPFLVALFVIVMGVFAFRGVRKALKEGGIKIGSVVVDGLDLGKTSKADLDCFADFVKAEKMTAWFSYTNEAADLKGTLDADKLADFATVGHLAANGNALSLTILKNGDGKANLDAKTLLFTK